MESNRNLTEQAAAKGIALDDADETALESLHHKQVHLETAVLSLAERHDTGLFVFGEGGIGKSYMCEEKLKEIKAPYVLHNSRLTGRGLVDELAKAPDSIHWIEDAETLLSDKLAVGVIRSACWSQSQEKPMKREITWTAHKTQIRVNFTGGILVVSNASLADTLPEIRAIKSRIRVLRLDVSTDEIVALMKTICQRGHLFGQMGMTPDECWEVATFIRERLTVMRRSIDLRLLKHGFHDYLLHREHHTDLNWQEMLEARMAETATRYRGRKQQTMEEAAIASEIHRTRELSFDEKVSEWHMRTGKSQSAYDRALKR